MVKAKGANVLVALTAASVLLVGGVVGVLAADHPGGGPGNSGGHGNSQVVTGDNGGGQPGNDGQGANPGADNGNGHGRPADVGNPFTVTGPADVTGPSTVTGPADVTGASTVTGEAGPNGEGGQACPSGITSLAQAESSGDFRNHGEFVSCVARGEDTLASPNTVSGSADLSVSGAAQSDVGKPDGSDVSPETDGQ